MTTEAHFGIVSDVVDIRDINMTKISDENLQFLIDGLTEFKAKGVIDPWILGDGTTIEPLDVLLELQEIRKNDS